MSKSLPVEPAAELLHWLAKRRRQVAQARARPVVTGRLVRVVGLTLVAMGVQARVGSRCQVRSSSGRWLETEVVGFADDSLHLMAVEHVEGLQPGAEVRVVAADRQRVPAGPGLLGRVLDGMGRPLDGGGPLDCSETLPWEGVTINPLDRHPISEPLDVGVRPINAQLSVGRGQRLGLFAGSGVGKSVLLGMMTRFTAADVVVVGLVGERGREVREFIDQSLGPEGLARAIVVAAPADDPPLMRLRAATLATRLAEYFRDRGQHVLLLMDSLTRYAQAQREIALSVGEPPATRGYPPSVFALLPQLVERAGNNATGSGSITAFYTVLTEGDDLQDPVADSARAILDGHVVLSRTLADEGHYPAIDIEASISRAMPAIVSRDHLQAALQVKQWYARYQQSRDLIAVGAYVEGSDPETDEALRRLPAIRRFLQQGIDEAVSLQDSLDQLQALVAPAEEEA